MSSPRCPNCNDGYYDDINRLCMHCRTMLCPKCQFGHNEPDHSLCDKCKLAKLNPQVSSHDVSLMTQIFVLGLLTKMALEEQQGRFPSGTTKSHLEKLQGLLNTHNS